VETIYRVQNGEGYGPYGANFKHTGITSTDWARPTDKYHESHPCPNEDGIGEMPPGWLCAFATVDDLFEWFTFGELDAMKALGFNIWELDVSETHEDGTFTTHHGYTQMVFDGSEINHQELWEVGSC
jgi:hypothetical protein